MTDAGAQGVRVAAAVGDVLGQCAVGVDAPHIQRAVRQRAKRAAAADIGDLEPDALLGADAHDGEVAFERDAGALQRRDGDEARDHAGGAVEIAAMRDGVEWEPTMMRCAEGSRPGRVM